MSNPLVDKNSQFEWGDYLPGIEDEGSDYGGTSKWNPFTPGQGYTTGDSSWFEGLPIIDSVLTLVELAQSEPKSGLEGLQQWIDATAAGIDIVGTAASDVTGDWGGAIVAPAVSWALEHVKPLRLLLDEVTGNQDAVNAVANTWHNMSQHLAQAARTYQDQAGRTDQFWQGEAGDAYRGKQATGLVEAMASAAALSDVFGTLVYILGRVVGIVHDFIRELIAAAIGQIVQDVAEALTIVGAAAIPAQTSGEIARLTGVAAKAVARATKEAFSASALAKQILPVLSELLGIIDHLTKE